MTSAISWSGLLQLDFVVRWNALLLPVATEAECARIVSRCKMQSTRHVFVRDGSVILYSGLFLLRLEYAYIRDQQGANTSADNYLCSSRRAHGGS